MSIRTKRGAIRRYNAIIRKYRRDFAGGGMFGFDLPTMRSNCPEAYAEIQALRDIYPKLPA